MKKNSNKKKIKKVDGTELQAIVAELSEISQKREKELAEMDRIAKMLVRRDFELMTVREKLEESKKILEIKVEARTGELKELAEGLEETVKKRTKDLEKKTGELEESKGALLNILEDIEEARIKAEEERNKTLSIINNLADGLLVFDPENKLILINPQAEDFFKFRAGETIGKTILELSKFPSFKPLANLLEEKPQKIFREEISLSQNLILEVSTIPISGGKEKKLGNLVILHDVSREKMVEKMKTEFVSLTAHQLRTPLSAIKWTLRMILDGDLGPITEEQRDFIQKTYQSNERMIDLINDLLNVARIEEGRYLYKSVLAGLKELIQSLLNSYKGEIQRKKLRLEFKIEKKLPLVKIDVEKMGLAIGNLLDNAITYTPSGGYIIISLKHENNKLKFSVQDTGIGIPKEQQKRVFTKFFRGANAVRAETEGTGLGLFIVKNIIEAHGGEIWFESEEGKGTTFYFTLPVEK